VINISKRSYKCLVCSEKYLDDDMIIVEKVGKSNRRVCKGGCHNKYLADKEKKRIEKEQLDDLVEVIKEVHGIEIIPPQFYSYLQDIRNGNELFGRVGTKKSKQGYSYKEIAETYKSITDSINWALSAKQFTNTMNMLKYTRSILLNNISTVIENANKEEYWNQSQQANKTEEAFEDPFEHYEKVSSKKKSNNDDMDISSFI
jgi:ribosomal protein S19